MRSVASRFAGIGVLAVASALIAACGGGGSGSPSVPPPPTTSSPTAPPSTPTPNPASTTFPLSQSGPVALPSVDGLSGTVTIPTNNAPSGATMTVTVVQGKPQGGPTPASANRNALGPVPRPFQTGAPNVLFSLELTVSQNVTFPGFPGFSLTLPSSFPTAGEAFFIAAYNGTSSSATLLDTIPASVSGQTLTFASGSTPFSLDAGATYLLELYETSVSTPSPTSSPTPASTPVASPNTLSLYVAGSPAPFAVTESGYNGSFTAGEPTCTDTLPSPPPPTNNFVVQVTGPSSSPSGATFTVTPGNDTGVCTVTVTDTHGGSATVQVYVSGIGVGVFDKPRK
jgi:hypothetical protein